MLVSLLLRRLDKDGAQGADLSPGDPVAAEAAAVIRSLLDACNKTAEIFESAPTSPDDYTDASNLIRAAWIKANDVRATLR